MWKKRPKKLKPINDFKCDKCEFTASSKIKIEKHIKVVHEKIKEFICAECEYVTSQKGRLRTHMVKKHEAHWMFSE